MKTLPCDEEALDAAAEILNRGGVAVIPTDTVYGLAAHPEHPEAVERLYSIKARDARKPIAMLASGAEAVRARGAFFPPAAERMAAERWPGALTLVLPCGGGFEGFRVPDHEWTRRLIGKCGGLLRVTSANMSGRRPATDAAQALAEVGLSADAVVDGGVSPGGVPSEVVRVSQDGSCETLRR